ncbi:sensor histidine kinase NtrY-like [Desulfobaculum bizertense]|uniref:histidine kinase n=1 Tax=Desulfobaculum bizertense DSM 18034 TaxID=1121442 RepID=A0A1T4WH61_9BACT|nr:ATP-binding protein [Desulfobaculum bizertense]UIJ39361.1 ATP-binding protein [Desulfobaculum bizertense]SKA76663.1 two-component system, NtrC family, nitrogen regulation sensor histidine kinase NtrY [Desulfobaculum bizertense DSM 18034]
MSEKKSGSAQKKWIKVGTGTTRERKRRQRELALAAVALLFVVVLTWIELRYFGDINSLIFLGLFNINVIILFAVIFVVLRNVIKLVLERRRNVLGSKLRSRLVISFVTLSIVPTMLMFAMGAKFVQTSVDFWFKTQVEDSLEQALEVGQAFYASSQERLERRSKFVLQRILDRRLAWGGKTMDAFLKDKREEYDLTLIGVISTDLSPQNWHANEEWSGIWEDIRDKVNWKSLSEKPEFWSTVRSGSQADMVIGLLPVDGGKTGYLVLGESIGHGLLYKLDKIVHGISQYKQIRTMKHQWKLALYVLLGVVTMLIVMGAIWFGMRLAKELSAPVQALADGTQRVARGDLAVRLEDSSSDELGFLVQSFNEMAEDLQVSRTTLTQVNDRLEQQNAELEQRGRYIEALLNNITAGVISLNQDERISTVNRAAETMLGLDGSLIVGKRPLDLLYGEYAGMLKEVIEQMASNPASQWQRQLTVSLGSRELKLLVNAVTLMGSDGAKSGLVIVFEDITELEKMQRVAAWREVARRIAHEIKNPLTPIKLSAQRMERKFGKNIEDPVFTQSTQLIVSQVEQLQQMVQEFSSFAKLPEMDLKLGDLTPVLEEVTAMFRNSHSSVRWSLDMEEDLPRLRFDKEGIRRVFINILTNAVDAVKGQNDPSVDIVVTCDKMLGWVRLEFQDSGEGLTQEERSRLFEPYFSRKKGGTGLGLTIVKSIVSDHHGYVRAMPREPHGTTLVVELPV